MIHCKTFSGQLVFFSARICLLFIGRYSCNKTTKTLSLEMVTKSKQHHENRNNMQTVCIKQDKTTRVVNKTLVNDLPFRMPQHTSSEVTVG